MTRSYCQPISFCLLLLTLTAACAPNLLYHTGGTIAEPAQEAARMVQAIAIERALADESVERLRIKGPQGEQVLSPNAGATAIAALEAPVLAALAATLDKDARGGEHDLLVPSADPDVYTPVTVLRERDGLVVVKTGAPWRFPEEDGDAPTSQEFHDRFGIGPLIDDEASWAPRERRVLWEALDAMDSQEREALEGVPFVRRGKSADDKLAVYVLRLGSPRVEVFEETFSTDRRRFVGSQDAPHQRSVLILLHEIGHSLECYLEAMLELQYRKDHSLRNQEATEVLQQINSAIASGNQAEFDQQMEELRKELVSWDTQLTQVLAVQEQSPVVDAYKEARHGRAGPTPYGMTHLKEAFAEAYALWRMDPEALRRTQPEVLAWFQSGGFHHVLRNAGSIAARRQQRQDAEKEQQQQP